MCSLFGCTKKLRVQAAHYGAPLSFKRTTTYAGPDATEADGSVPLNSWMATIPDHYSLAQLSLPGTHNACARYEPIGGTARCQALTLNEQLNAGIRFLDIRCRHVNNAFAIHHGAIYQRIRFEEVLAACANFLDNNPSECIIMSIKEEYTPSHNTRSFEQSFDAYARRYAAKWYLGAAIPPIGSVRGRIVLLRRFAASQAIKGIDASRWEHNATFTIHNAQSRIRVQDQFVVPDNQAKWHNSTALLQEASSRETETLYINFTSGYRPALFHIPDIQTVANVMSGHITDYFSAHPQGRYGIIAMDFADPRKAALIIATNYRHHAPVLTYALNQVK
ncbi:hypothetical protein GCM10009415_19570 [Chitinophaga japonensis]